MCTWLIVCGFILLVSFTCLWRPAKLCEGVWGGMRVGGGTACLGQVDRPQCGHHPVDLSKDGGRNGRKNTDGWSAAGELWEAVDIVQAEDDCRQIVNHIQKKNSNKCKMQWNRGDILFKQLSRNEAGFFHYSAFFYFFFFSQIQKAQQQRSKDSPRV